MNSLPINSLAISKAAVDDLADLKAMAARITDQHAHLREPDYFERNFTLQDEGHRIVFLARLEGRLSGYCILNMAPRYRYFQVSRIPEIQDVIVEERMRRHGIATALIHHCETHARAVGVAEIGLGVGLHKGFGPAQRLYAKLGYIPDGQGLNYDRQPLSVGEFRPVDDELCLMLVKRL